MKKTLRNLILVTGMIGLASILSVKQAKAEIGGWLEASLGQPTKNLRLYPSISGKSLKLQSLIDNNGYYRFSKTDLFYDKLKASIGPFAFKPVGTLFTDPYDKQIMGGVNASWGNNKGFGFFEIAAGAKTLGSPKLYSYNSVNLPSGLGRVGLFSAGSITDMINTYFEVEATGPRFARGISPYVRANLQNGVKPGFQGGVSVTPRELIGR